MFFEIKENKETTLKNIVKRDLCLNTQDEKHTHTHSETLLLQVILTPLTK